MAGDDGFETWWNRWLMDDYVALRANRLESAEAAWQAARRAALEECAVVCDECRVLLFEAEPSDPIAVAKETGNELARQIREKISEEGP